MTDHIQNSSFAASNMHEAMQTAVGDTGICRCVQAGRLCLNTSQVSASQQCSLPAPFQLHSHQSPPVFDFTLKVCKERECPGQSKSFVEVPSCCLPVMGKALAQGRPFCPACCASVSQCFPRQQQAAPAAQVPLAAYRFARDICHNPCTDTHVVHIIHFSCNTTSSTSTLGRNASCCWASLQAAEAGSCRS